MAITALRDHDSVATVPGPAAPPRRIAVFYPWGDFGERRSGASLRMGLLLDTLAPLAEEIRVLHGGWGDGPRQDRVVGIAAPPPRYLGLLRRALRLAVWPLLGRAGQGQHLPLWWHLERLADPRFRRQVRALVQWADVVLLEYTFWGAIVQAACRREGVPCIVTDYDVMAQQVTRSRLLRRISLALEVAVLRRATHAVAVSPGDAAAFAAAGVATRVIANCIETARAAVALPLEPRAMLRDLFDIALPDAPVCLFVGSGHPPNLAAVAHIRALAAAMAEQGTPAFVVAGTCAPPGRAGGVLALGSVDAAVLAALYRLADVILVPLRDGTGSSLKTLEAFAWGRPVLGTAVAFRGLPVTPGVDCLLEDDFARWPEAIAGLLAQAARRQAIGAAARRLAETFDRRRVFAGYLPLLGLPAVAPADMAAQVQHDVAAARQREAHGLATRALERGRIDIVRRLLDVIG